MAQNNLNIFVSSAGAGEPLVLLHGFMGSTKTWDAHIAALSSQYRLILVDLPGHGASESSADLAHYTMSRCIDVLWAIFEYMKLERAHLLGYSMGGRVALSFAVAHPERISTLILESASPGLATAEERAARIAGDLALAEMIEQKGLEAFVDYWENLPLFASQKQLPATTQAAIRAARLNNNPVGLANSLRGTGAGAQPSLWEELPSIQIPTLLLAGGLDSKYTILAQKMAARMPNAHFAIIPDVGHTIHLEQPETFDAKVLDFLEDYSTISTD